MKTQKTILIVEDEVGLREALGEMLKEKGHSVQQAGNGEEGLKKAEDGHPDLILLDIAMPRMDGMTMLGKLRQDSEWGRKVPVIILTNLNADDKILRNIVQNEPAYYLVKADWHAQDIAQKVNDCLNHPKRSQLR